jgi:hypothetical protein
MLYNLHLDFYQYSGVERTIKLLALFLLVYIKKKAINCFFVYGQSGSQSTRITASFFFQAI